MEDTIDYRSRYEHALILAKDWYKHYFDGYTSIADVMKRHPQSYMSLLYQFSSIETFLPRMFPELNNDEDWWKEFYDRFYERNKDNPEYSFR